MWLDTMATTLNTLVFFVLATKFKKRTFAHVYTMAADKCDCDALGRDKVDNTAGYQCPNAPVTSVTGHRNRTVTFKFCLPGLALRPVQVPAKFHLPQVPKFPPQCRHHHHPLFMK